MAGRLWDTAVLRLPAWQSIPVDSGFPGYTRWIAAHSEVRAYLELPLGKRPHWEAGAMYLQTTHWRPLVNGYSAVLPPSFIEVANLCQPFPDLDGLARLSELGVSHVVLHRRTPGWPPGREARGRVFRFLPSFDRTLRDWGARRVFSEPDVEIYDIARGEHRTEQDHGGAVAKRRGRCLRAPGADPRARAPC